jgi:thiol-disulfide isomerase/thioredoxin
MRKIQIIAIIALILSGTAFGQVNQSVNVAGKIRLTPNIPNLKVGARLPDFEIPKIIKSTKRNIRSSDFNNQLLIINFWSIYCSGCIAAMPRMDSLQKYFGNKIRILPVTYEAETLVSNFWKKNRNTKNLSLFSVVEDRILSSYFRHQTIPHEVWIYKGKVIAITSEQYVDRKNIQKILNGEAIKWPEKNDFLLTYQGQKPLFELNKLQADPSTIIQYAAISDYKEQVNSEGLTGGSGVIRDQKEKKIRIFFINQPIAIAYEINWRNLIQPKTMVRPSLALTPNQTVWEVADKSKYKYDSKTDYLANWIRKHGICFESLASDTGQTEADISKSTIANLNSLLGLNVRWEKRKEKVLILIRTSKNDKIKSRTTLTDFNDQLTVSGSIRKFRATSLANVVYKLNEQEQNPYVFDETAYRGEVDLDLDIDVWTNIAAMRKALQEYDLDLKEEVRLIDKFIFTEIEGGLLKDEAINNKL